MRQKSLGRRMIQFHPIANIFPLMEGKEFDDFKQSIKDNGLRDPIILYEGKILDGRNRYRACMFMNVEIQTEQFNGRGDPVDFVLDRNLHRRHLSEGERAMAVTKAKMNTWGGKQDRHIDLALMSNDEAAKLAKVSSCTISNAREIHAHGTPEEINAVSNGTMAITPMAHHVRARRQGKPVTEIKPRREAKGRPKGPMLKTKIKVFQRTINYFCTSCEHIEDIEIPQLTGEQIRQAVVQLKSARVIIHRLIDKLKPTGG